MPIFKKKKFGHRGVNNLQIKVHNSQWRPDRVDRVDKV